MSSTSLTSYLLQHNARVPYAAATEHLFLTQAGDGTLPSRRLALWLSQDRIYAAHAYPRFIGRLIAAIPFSSNIDPKEIASQNRILKALVEALNNIVREANFFVDVATKYGLDINCWHERQGTRNYTAEMARVSSESLQDGLVFLWAMEKVYLDAWKYAKMQSEKDATRSQAVATLIENWTTTEFESFVKELGIIVDELNIHEGSSGWKRAQEIWERVIELEVGFWPNEGEELDMNLSQ